MEQQRKKRQTPVRYEVAEEIEQTVPSITSSNNNLASPRTSARRKAAASVTVDTSGSGTPLPGTPSSSISRQMSFARPAPSPSPLTTPVSTSTSGTGGVTVSTTPSRRQLAAAAMAARIARGAASASDSELSGGTTSGTESAIATQVSSSLLSASSTAGSRRNLLRAPSSRAVLASAQGSQASYSNVPIVSSQSKPRVPRQQRGAPVTVTASISTRSSSIAASLPPPIPASSTSKRVSEKSCAAALPPRIPSMRHPSRRNHDDLGAADTTSSDHDNYLDQEKRYDEENNSENEEEEEDNNDDEDKVASFDVENDDESVLAIPEIARETLSSAPTPTRSTQSYTQQQQQVYTQQQRRADLIPLSAPTPPLQTHTRVPTFTAPAHQLHSPPPPPTTTHLSNRGVGANQKQNVNLPVQYNDLDYDDDEEEEEEERVVKNIREEERTHSQYRNAEKIKTNRDGQGEEEESVENNENNSTHLIYDDFTDELDSSVAFAHPPTTHMASSSVSPCGGQVVYGIASEDVNPLGSATMDFPQSALHLEQQAQAQQQQEKKNRKSKQHPALARLASVRATQGRSNSHRPTTGISSNVPVYTSVEATRFTASNADGYESSSDDNEEEEDDENEKNVNEDTDALYYDTNHELEPQELTNTNAPTHPHLQPQSRQVLEKSNVYAPTIVGATFGVGYSGSGAQSDCGSTESSSAQTAEAMRRLKSQARLDRYGDVVHATVRNTATVLPTGAGVATTTTAGVSSVTGSGIASTTIAATATAIGVASSSSSKAVNLTPPRMHTVSGVASLTQHTPRAVASSPPSSALRQRHSQPRRTPPSATAINIKEEPPIDMDENPSSTTTSAPITLSFEEFTLGAKPPQPDSPPLPVPAPLFNLRVSKHREAYRPSTSLNEDDYDYAIVVRAVVTQKQEAGLAKAKAQADSIAAAARANAALFGVPSGFDLTRTPEARLGERTNANASSAKMVRGTSNLSDISLRTGGGLGSSTLRMLTPGVALKSKTSSSTSAMRSVAEEANEEEDEDEENTFENSLHAPAHDSASESDSDSGSASEDDGGEAGEGGKIKSKRKGEDESWYNEWDNEDSDGEEEEEEEEKEEGSISKNASSSKKGPSQSSTRSSKHHRSKSADATSSSKRRRRRAPRKSILDTITGLAERGIARVRKSLGGNTTNHATRSASTPSRKNKNGDETTSKKSVKFESQKSEAVITILPRSPEATNSRQNGNGNGGKAVAFVDKISSPNLFAHATLSPLADDENDDEQGEEGEEQGGKVHKCAEILSALRTAGLEAKRVRSLSRRTWLIKIRCSEWRLEIEAEKLRLRMRRRDGGWSKYRRSMRNAFVPAIPDKDDDDDSVVDDDDTQVSNPKNDDDENTFPDTSSSNASKKNKKKTRSAAGKERPSLFHSSDRQTLIDHILRSSAREGGAELGTGSPLGAYVTHMFPLHMHTRLNELQSDWLMVWRPERSYGERDRIGNVDPAWYAEPKLIDVGSLTATAVASLKSKDVSEGITSTKGEMNNGNMNNRSCCSGGLRRCCARSSAVKYLCSTFPVRFIFSIGVAIGKFVRSIGRLSSRVLTQPLDRIAAYFGETIAFYFAWLEFYTQWLVVPSIIGVLLFVWQLYYGSLDVAWSPIFSLFMAVWSMLFLEFWKRRNAELAQRWGVLHYEDEEVVRPQFIGEWKQDASTGEMVRIYPAWRRAAKYAIVTVPFVLTWVFGILYLMVFVYAVRDQMLYQFEIHEAISRTRTAIMSNATLASYVTSVPEDISIDIHKSIISAWRGGILQFLRGEARELASELHKLDPISYLAKEGLLRLDPLNTTLGSSTGASHSGSSVASSFASIQPSPSPLPGLSSGFSLDHLHVDLNKLSSYFQSNDDWRWWLVMVLPPICLGLLMPMIDYLFGALAFKLNEWENHATESHFRNHRIAKVFFFRFAVSFTSLFYYAFSPQQSAMQLSVQLATFLVVGQVWSKFLDVVLPLFWRRVREFKFARRLQHAEDSGLTEGRRGRRLMRHAKQQAWVESRMPQYDSFDDYAQMLMQFGYVTFFSWAFPLAPACALINNLIEMRSDGFKLCHLAQRPLAFKSGGIGVWYNVLVAMSMLAVLTNCAHLALSATNLSGSAAVYFLPDWNLTETQKIFIVFVCEHVVLSLRLVMPYIVPPVPQKVKRRLERDNYALAKLQGRRSLGNL